MKDPPKLEFQPGPDVYLEPSKTEGGGKPSRKPANLKDLNVKIPRHNKILEAQVFYDVSNSPNFIIELGRAEAEEIVYFTP